MKFHYPEGATPLDLDETAGLIPKHITTQYELNAWEEKNIIIAEQWAHKQKSITSIELLKELHKRMFNHTWKWAGQFRRSEKNIGVPWNQVSIDLRNLCDDIDFQMNNSIYSPEEIALRFHHRLTQIHAFPNGNGRHARLAANILIVLFERPKFSWGLYQSLTQDGLARKYYIEALREADNGDYSALLKFAK